MATPRQPASRVTTGMLVLALLAAIPITLFFVHRSYFLGGATLATVIVGFAIYFLGMSSGLPGTSGRNGRNVRP
jgi:hypothetical protein